MMKEILQEQINSEKKYIYKPLSIESDISMLPLSDLSDRDFELEGTKPKRFEIDFLNGNDAIELKWRDATTDGDHIIKEHTRIRAIKNHGYKPIRLFYYPQSEQAIKIQEILKTIYTGVGGEYYVGDEAWNYLKNITNYDLKAIFTEIAQIKDNESKDN